MKKFCETDIIIRYQFILMFLLLLSSPLFAQYTVNYHDADFFVQRMLDTESGLPANGINEILQDSEGYVWAATYNGITRFDGKDVRVYDTSNVEGLGTNRALDLIEDGNGCIWTGLEYNYLLKICRNSTEVFYLDEVTYGFNNHISTLAEESDGKIWIGTTKGLVILENGEFGKLDQLPFEIVRQIRFHKDKAYALFQSGLYRLNRDGKFDEIVAEFDSRGVITAGDIIVDELADESIIVTDFIFDGDAIILLTHTGMVGIDIDGREYEILFTKEDLKQELLHGMGVFDGSYFIYGSDGLSRVTRSDGNSWNIIKFDDARGSSVVVDHEGSIWFGTSTRGIIQIISTPVYQGDRYDIFSGTATMATLTDYNGNFWVATNCDGLYRLNNGKITRYDADLGIFNTCIWSLMEQSNGTIWAGTWGGGVYVKNRNSETFEHFNPGILQNINEILAVFEDKDGNIWFGSYYDGIFKYDGEEVSQIPAQRGGQVEGVRQFYEAEDRIWIASDRGAGYIHDDRAHLPGSLNILKSRNFRAIVRDSQNRLWFGSYGGGLLIVEGNKEPLKLSTEHGLQENAVSHLRFDENNNLWLAGNKGVYFIESDQISKFLSGEIEQVRVSKLSTAEGMPVSETTGGFMPANSLTDEGMLYIPTVRGLAAIQTRNKDLNRTPPRVKLESVNVDDNYINTVDLDKLKHDTQRLVFRFSVLSFKNPDYVNIKYKLDGVDDEWRAAGNSMEAVYTTLHPGKYHFNIMASNNDGFWSEPIKAFSFTVTPPFWKTAWFYILITGFFTIIVAGFIQYRTKKIKENEKILQKIVDEQTMQLKLEKKELESINKKLKESNEIVEKNKKIIEAQACELQKQNEMKSRFFTNVSHEFRTPLTLVKGITSTFNKGKHGKLSGDAKKDLKILSSSIGKIEQRIDQLLEMAIMESNEIINVTKKQYDLGNQVKLICNLFDSWAKGKNAKLTVNLPDFELLIYADQRRIESSLINLISNSIKNIPSGGRIKVDVRKTENNKECNAVITITDSGPPIPVDERKYIFDRFYQSKRAPGMEYGLGLALAKEWAGLHGGKLIYDDEQGKQKFNLVLPLDKEPNEEKQKVQINNEWLINLTPTFDKTIHISKPPEKINKETLLVVEDDQVMRIYLRKILDSEYNILEASDGEKALEIVRKRLPDLILSDIMMPVMDGFEFCRKLRNDPEISYIPFILLTARVGDKNKLQGLQRGADDYILKPFNEDILLETIKNQLDARKRLSLKLLKEETLKMKFPVSNSDSFMESLDKVIDDKIEDPDLTVKLLAKELNTSQRQLQRKVKEFSELTPQQYIRKRRLKIARHLLKEESGTVSEVAYAVGFNNLSLFSSYFKSEFGILPSKFKSSG